MHTPPRRQTGGARLALVPGVMNKTSFITVLSTPDDDLFARVVGMLETEQIPISTHERNGFQLRVPLEMQDRARQLIDDLFSLDEDDEL